uniref:HIRA interacting protein 3 n=1 Tax=Pipistrellus kuhlii TaxID=59472 RepID=A0A7J7S5K0_PIPKU|nr:HIRA interacting protein 3 [Pipistrellus kuhlii]
MARENEMREFTRSFFRGRPDLSTLTHSIVRRKFLAHTGSDHLSPKEKQALKRLVEEELLKMQVDEAGARGGLNLAKKTKKPPTSSSDPERKRFRLNSDSGGSPQGERKGRSYRKSAKQSRSRSSSSSANGSPELKGRKVREKMGREATVKKKQVPGKMSASRKQAIKESEDSEEELAQRMENKRAKRHQESETESDGEETLAKKENREADWKPRAPKNGGEKSAWEDGSSKQKSLAAEVLGDGADREEEKESAAGSGDDSEGDEEPLVQRKGKDRTQWADGRRQSGSSEEDGEDSCRKLKPATKGRGKSAKAERRKTTNDEASDSEREASDSEAGASLQGERKGRSYRKSAKKSRSRSSSSSSANGSPEPKGRKAGHRDEDHPAVMRLKRYIRACGAHRNYKKLLGSCRSRKERLSVLRAELEALGMKGNPSLEKCRALKEQREEAAEVASLDITNIISCSGRPRRRTAWNPSEPAAPGELYRRTLDSEEEQHCPPRPDWSHMRGIISSDGESN